MLLILSLSFALTVFTSCNSKKEGPNTGVDSNIPVDTGGKDDGDSMYDENGYKRDSLPEMNFQYDEVDILCWNSQYSEFDTEYGGNVVDNAIFLRNEAVQTRLGVTLHYESTNGNAAAVGDYKSKVLNAFNNGDYWDIIASYTRTTAVCASSGLLKDLGSLQGSYLDFSEPWWSQDLIETTAVGDTFYFCTGDISTNLIQMTYCMYFNSNLLNSMEVTSPYTMVANNEWTLANMLDMNKDIYLDLNQNDLADVGDQLGIVGTYYAWPAILHGCDVPIVEKGSAGTFIMNPAYKGEKAINIMTTLKDSITNKLGLVEDQSKNVFLDGNAAFYITESGSGLNAFSSVTFDYGCVPMPKYDSTQETYYCAVRQPITLYGVMVNVPDSRIGEVTATLECLCSEGYRRTTPVIFEECMKYLSATSPEMAEMLELIRDTAWFDCARIYSNETKFVCDMPGRCLQNGETWEGYVNGKLPAVEEAIKKLSAELLSVSIQ